MGQHITVADFAAITSVTQMSELVPVDAEKYPKLNVWIKRFDDIPNFNQLNTIPKLEFLKVVENLRAKNKEAAIARS